MRQTTRQLTLCAMLTALALALSWVERFLPLSLLIPLPGIKLGLANIVTLFALYALGPAQALLILLCRCTLGVLGRVVVGLGDKALVDLGGDLVVDFLIVPITEDGFQPVNHR